MSTSGFDSGQESALNELRQKVKKRGNNRPVTEDKGILLAADGWTNSNVGTLSANVKKRAACLKLLRHVYLQNKSGNKKVWVVNLPNDFTDWPSKILGDTTTISSAKQLLASSNQHFSDKDRRHLGSSTQHAMNWCQKTGMVLSNAASGTNGTSRTKACALVKRWFLESNPNPARTTDQEDTILNGYISTLKKGFNAIVARLTKGNFIVTDWVPFRGTSDADELSFLASEAFTFGSYG